MVKITTITTGDEISSALQIELQLQLNQKQPKHFTLKKQHRLSAHMYKNIKISTYLELPQLSVMRDSARTEYGKSAAAGKAGSSALSARFPCPTSLLLSPPTLPTCT